MRDHLNALSSVALTDLREECNKRIYCFQIVAPAALKLVLKDRARLAGKLLRSLEDLSEEENEMIWAQEAERRDAAWSSSADGDRTAERVLRGARAKLK